MQKQGMRELGNIKITYSNLKTSVRKRDSIDSLYLRRLQNDESISSVREVKDHSSIRSGRVYAYYSGEVFHMLYIVGKSRSYCLFFVLYLRR